MCLALQKRKGEECRQWHVIVGLGDVVVVLLGCVI